METTTTKTVTRGIYNRVPTGCYIGGVEQISTVKTGEQTTHYAFTAHADSIEINGVKYRVENPERTDPVRQVLIDPLKLF